MHIGGPRFDPIEAISAGISGFRYLVSKSYRREVHDDRWSDMPVSIIIVDIAAAVGGILFIIFLIFLVLAGAGAFQWGPRLLHWAGLGS